MTRTIVHAAPAAAVFPTPPLSPPAILPPGAAMPGFHTSVINAFEFGDAGDVEISFVPNRPGEYAIHGEMIRRRTILQTFECAAAGGPRDVQRHPGDDAAVRRAA